MRSSRKSVCGRGLVLRNALQVAVFLAAVLTARIAFAAAENRFSFDIPPGPLRESALVLSDQTNYQVFYDYQKFRTIPTRAVSGQMDLESALDQMLQGTGLTYVILDRYPKTIVLKPLPPTPTHRQPAPARRPPQWPPVVQPIPNVTVLGTPTLALRPPGAEVLTLTRWDIERMGLSTLAEVIRTLPQVWGGGPSEDTHNVGREAPTNSGLGYGINVRGLDAGSAAVLLNGQRLPLSGAAGTFVDVSNVPSFAIEEVQLLPGGASSRYGSDGVAGVVNIITRDPTSSPETLLRYGSGSTRSYDERTLGQWLTRAWSSGDGALAIEYFDHRALPASRSPQTKSDLTGLGGSNFDTIFANPGTLIAAGSTYRIPMDQDGTSLKPGDLTRGVNRANRFEGTDVLPNQERWSFYGSLHQRVAGGFELSGHALVSEREARTHASPVRTMLTIPSRNPFYLNPANPASVDPVQVAYDFGPDLGPILADVDVSTRSFTLEGAGRTGRLRWGASLNHGSERQKQDTYNLVNSAALSDALKDTDPGTAFDAFGDGSHTNPITLDKIRTNARFSTDSDITSVDVFGEYTPQDAIRVTFGAEHREQRFSSSLAGHGASADMQDDLSRDIDGVYAEGRLALSAESGSTVAQRAELYVGARYDDFSDFGGTTAPQLGIDFIASPTWVFRMNWRRAVRAPGLTDLVETGNFAAIFPEINPGSGQPVPALFVSGNNAALGAERSRSWSFGADFTPSMIPDFSLALTYYQTNFFDRISGATYTSTILGDPSYAGRVESSPTTEQRAAICSRVAFLGTPADCVNQPVAALIDLRLMNLLALKTSGLDLLTRYALFSSFGMWDFALNANYVFRFAEAPTHDSGFMELVNTLSHPPRFRARASGTWMRGGWTAGAVLQFTNRYREAQSPAARDIASSTLIDLSAGYAFQNSGVGARPQTSIAVDVHNLFDRNPPFANNAVGVGYDQENADPLGRTVTLTLRHKW